MKGKYARRGRADKRAARELLAEQGVTEEELLRFAETRGGDVVYMKELWSDVERRMGELRLPPDESR